MSRTASLQAAARAILRATTTTPLPPHNRRQSITSSVPLTCRSAATSTFSQGVSAPGGAFKPLLPRGKSYEEVYDAFQWRVPPHYNMGVDVCDKHPNADALAMILHRNGAEPVTYSFADIRKLSNKLSNVLCGLGTKRGDSAFDYFNNEK